MKDQQSIEKLYRKNIGSFFKIFFAIISALGVILALTTKFSDKLTIFLSKFGVLGITIVILSIGIITLFRIFNNFKKNVVENDLLYYNVHERSKIGNDVKGCIVGCQKEIFISGAVLLYIAKSCSDELLIALNNNTKITIVISKQGAHFQKIYERYSNDFTNRLKTSRNLYQKFYNSLSDTNKERFDVRETSEFLTHSIGYYDSKIFISEFCIDTDSSKAPSYFIDGTTLASKPFDKEISFLKKGSTSILR